MQNYCIFLPFYGIIKNTIKRKENDESVLFGRSALIVLYRERSLYFYAYEREGDKSMKKSALLLVVMLVVTMCFCLAACDKDNVLVQHVCSFGEWTVTEPTCEADGARTRKCERCGAEETVVLQKSGHTEVIDAAKTATCTETGLTEGKHCSVCNKVLVAQKEIAKLGHSYGEWIVVSKLTCTTDGEKKRVCQTCGYEDKQIEKAVGHKISEEWTIDKEATPDSDGQKSRHCKNSTILPI